MTLFKRTYKKVQSQTNSTTSAILTLISHYKGFGCRINTSGIPIIVNGKIMGWRKSKSKGHPDIDGCYKGFSFKVEVKTGKDKLSDVQIEFIKNYESSGGKCFIVKDSIDFEKQFTDHFKIKL